MRVEQQYSTSQLRLETQEEAFGRLSSLPVYHEVPKGLVYGNAHIDAVRTSSGVDWWVAHSPSSLSEYIDPTQGDDYARAYEAGVEAFHKQINKYSGLLDADGFWWNYSLQAKAAVEKNLRQVHRISANENHSDRSFTMDIMNATDADLSEEEIGRLERTMQAVSTFTRGKIFDRVMGIVLCADEFFIDHSLGGFNPFSGVMRLNFDEFRDNADALPPRYARYFKGRKDVGVLEITLAHEFGHGMGIRNLGEAAVRGIDINTYAGYSIAGISDEYSYFDTLPGWEHTVIEEGDGESRTVWRFNETVGLEYGEMPPTTYAWTKPREDEGESFGITALNADTSTMRGRAKAAHDMVDLTPAAELGPHTIAIEQVQSEGVFVPGKLQAIKLAVGVPRT